MTKRSGSTFLLLGLIIAVGAGPAAAFDRLILGKRLYVADTTGLEPKRKIVAEGRESPSDIAVLSNPTLSGATLEVITNGGTSRHDTYTLDPFGWTASGGGYKYKGPTGGDGDPVRSVTLKRTASGLVQLKAQIRGDVGVQDVKVVPPNPGDDGGIILTVAGGDRYCVAFGAGAGGNETVDNVLKWKIVGAAAQPGCPTVATTTTTTTIQTGTTSSTSTTLPGPSPLCPLDTSRIIFAGGPNTGACHQFDDDQPSCEKAFHIGGQCGPASCFFDFQSGQCSGCGPTNEQEGRCVNTCVHPAASCPGDPTRTIFAGYAFSQACRNLDYSQTLCEKAYHIDGEGQPASCFWDGSGCNGCGPNNLETGECQNTCPVCEGDASRTLFAGGPNTAPCHRFDGAQASCEGAFIMSGETRAYTSCYYDAGSSECRGCGPNNQGNQECINTCPVCRDEAHQIFVGGPGTSACSIFDNSAALCEQSFHMSGQCNELASCYYDYVNGGCRGCGPNNADAGECTNECAAPICGNGAVDVAGEQCDGSASTCGPDATCNGECQCQPCNANTIPPEGGVFSGTTSGASSFTGTCGYGTAGSPDQVYAWTPSTSGVADVTTCLGASFDTVVYMRQGSCNGPQIACNDDSFCGGSRITPTVTAGTTYYIVVDGYGGSAGSYSLAVVPASPSGAFLD